MDQWVTLIRAPHIVEERLHTLQTRLDAVGYVLVEIGEGFGIVHEKAPGG
jgi:hypothetical protein